MVFINDDIEVDVFVFFVYFQDEIEILEKLDIIIGVCFDSFEIDVYNVVVDESWLCLDEEIFLCFGIVFKLQENVLLYGSYFESFLLCSGEQFVNINGSNNVFDLNIYMNLEVGVKWDFFLNFSFIVVVFEIEQSLLQVVDNDFLMLDVIDFEIMGFEVQF